MPLIYYSGEPEHFQNVPPPPPDASNPEHQESIKRGQRILGGVLWLSTTRPDLAYAVSDSYSTGADQGPRASRDQAQASIAVPKKTPRRRDFLTYIPRRRRNLQSLPSLEIHPLHHQKNIPSQDLPFIYPTEMPDT